MLKRKFDYSSRFRILKGGKISLVVSALLGSVTLSYSAPTGGTVTSGNATISQNGTVTNINQSSSKASINWNNFSIGSGESVNFNQPNSSSITLNRVIGNEKSVIEGAMNANGQVWLLNSNGILFSKNASINTSGLLATTAQLSDQDFQNGNYNFKNSSSNSVINLGTIKVNNASYVVLAGKEVQNGGTIEALKGKVHLVGANEYSINLNGNSLVNLRVNKGVLDALVKNSGTILANGGEVFLTTNAVDELLKGVVNNDGIIEANSADDLFGKVELFAHGGTTEVSGEIKAEGGFVETSGKELNVSNETIIKANKWLIDPTDVTIDGGTGAIGNSSVGASVIASSLNSGTSVDIQADNDITVNSAISKTAGADATLTLTAGRNIELNADITSTSAALNIEILADNDYSGDGIVKLTSNLSSNGGDINFGDGTYFDSKSTTPTDSNDYLVGGDVYISSLSAQTINSNGGNITVNGEMLIANSSASGVTFNSNGGNVDFKGVVNSGNSYESVSYTGTWNDAKTNATSGTGSAIGDTYLATITSRLENIIAGQAVGYNTSWLGAKRTDSTGEWRWVTGTEGLQNNGAGLLFFTQTGGGTGTTTSGLYSNWNGGEPNGDLSTNNETALQFVGTQGLWNDLPYNSTTLDYYVKETNLANSKLTINAGSGNVTFGEDVGTSKAIDTLNVTANQTKLPSAITTSNIQTYDGGAVKLVYDTVLTTTNSDIKFDSTVDSFDALSPKNLTTNILADNYYYWVNWTSVSTDGKTVSGTITIGGKTIDVTYTNPNGFFGAQTDGSGTNYWTSTNSISPYTSTNVANGPSTTDIVQLDKEATQTLTFSESIENLAFSVVSMNGNGFWFDQDFNIESYTGLNGAGAGYYGTGTLVKVVEDGFYKLNDAQLTSPSEPHGTIRFNNSFSELTWNSHYENGWYGFTIGTSGASSDAGKVIFNNTVGGIVKLNDIDINAAMQTTADITSANSLDVSGFSNIGGDITTIANQNYQSAINLTSDATLTTTTNGNVSTNATIDGAYNLTINTNGTGDTTIGGAIGSTTALKNVSITTDVVNLNGINVENNSNITIANRSESTISDIISGTGVTFTKDEIGTLILTAENTFDGVTTISDGTLQLGNGGATGWVSSSSIVNNSNLVYNRSDETQYGGIISGTGNLEKKGTGTLILTKDNTYTGSTTITSGTLQLGNGGTEGSISDTSNVENNGTLKYNKASDTVANYLISGTGNVEIVGTSSLFFGDTDETNDIGFITTTAQVIATNTTVQDVLEKLAGGRMNGGAIGGILEAGVYNKDFTDGTFQVMMYSNGGTGNQWTKVVFVKLEQDGTNVTARAYEGRPTTNPGIYAVFAQGDVRGVDYRTAAISGTMPLSTTGDNLSSNYNGYGVDQLFTSSKVTFTKDNIYTGTTTLNTTVFRNDSDTSAQGSYYERKALAILQLGQNGTAGNIENSSSIVNNGVLIFNRSDDLTTTGDISGTGKITKLNNNTVTLSGLHSYTGSTLIDDGTLKIQNDAPTSSTSIFDGDGKLIIESASDDFTSAFSTSGWNFGTELTGLTIGKSATSSDGTSDADVTLASAININGPINIYGGNINVNANLDTQDGTTSGDILLKASGDITQAANVSVTTDGGDVIYWSNTDDSGDDGYILLTQGSSVSTNGGHVWLGGGAGSTTWNGLTVGDGYATAGAAISSANVSSATQGSSQSAITFAETSINTGGGNFAAYGEGDDSGERGIETIGDFTLNSGSGKIHLDAKSNNEISMIFGHDSLYTNSENVTITSSNTNSDAIVVNTASSNIGTGWSYGTWVEGTATAQTTNGGGIIWTTEGVAKGINLGYSTSAGVFNLLGNSGDITLNTKAKGVYIQTAGSSINLGRKSGTSVTTSSSDITLIADDFSSNGALNFNTSGALTIKSQVGNSFANAFDTSNLTYSSDVSGLTIGHADNTGDVTVGSAIDINGPINIYGGNINVNANLDTQGGTTSGDILLKASGDITQAASTSVTTDGGDVIYWSNSDNGTNSDGGILLRKNSSITTNGGNLWLGGGSSSTTWNGLTVGNGYALGGTTITPSNGGSDINAGIYFEDASVNTSNGNIAMYGQGTTARGITTYGSLFVNSGSGKILIDAKSQDGYALMMGVHNSIYASNQSFTSTNSSSDAIVVNAISDTSRGTTVEGNISFNTTNGGGISFTSLGSNVSGSLESIRLGYSSTSNGVLNLLANSGDITLNTGAKGINVQSAGSIFMGRKTGSPVTTSSSNITLIADDFSSNGPLNFNTSGTLTIKPQDGNSFASIFDTSNLTYSSDVSGLTIGHADNTGDVTVGSATSIAGPINIYGGNIVINDKLEATGTNTIKLISSGAVADGASGYVVADKLALKGSGDFTLDNALNNVTTLAAGNDDNSSVGAITFVNADGLIIGTVNPTGITSNGIINISTLTGNLEVTENISTTDTTSSAITLNAGSSESAGTSIGGDIIITSGKTITTGTDGRILLYTGSLNGSTGVASLVGNGSGNFRYNSDETTDFSTGSWKNLGTTGAYAIYREQPTASGVISNKTITYGDVDPVFSISDTLVLNGDDSVGLSISNPSRNGNILNAGTYSVTASGLVSLGYDVSSVTGGVLTVNKKALTVSANDDAKFVTQSDATNFNGVSYSGFVNGDDSSDLTGTLALTRTNSTVNTAGTYADVLVASGLSADNYLFNYVNGDYTIVGADQLLVRVNNVENIYGTATSYGIGSVEYYDSINNVIVRLDNNSVVNSSVSINASNEVSVNDGSNGTATFTLTPNLASYSTANKLKVGSYQISANGVITQNANNFGDTVTVIGSHQVNQQGLTASASNVSKTYDGTTAMSNVTLGLATLETNDVVNVTGTGEFSSKDVSIGLDYTISNLALSGTDALNYYISGGNSFSGSNGEITKRTLTVNANNLSKIFGTNDPSLTYNQNGLVSGDSFSGNLIRALGENSGEYAISQGTLSASSNYNLVFKNGIFTIGRDTKLDNVITSIANTTVITTPKIDVVVPQQVVVPTPVNTIVVPDGTVSTNVNVISKPLEAQPTKMVTMSEIKTSNASNDNGSTVGVNTDVRVPLSANSQIQLVNGGVNLPNGLEQQFFVVDNGNAN